MSNKHESIICNDLFQSRVKKIIYNFTSSISISESLNHHRFLNRMVAQQVIKDGCCAESREEIDSSYYFLKSIINLVFSNDKSIDKFLDELMADLNLNPQAGIKSLLEYQEKAFRYFFTSDYFENSDRANDIILFDQEIERLLLDILPVLIDYKNDFSDK